MLINIHVTPGGSKNQFQALQGDVFCIKLTAPPVEGAANKALVKFLSDKLKINKSHIRLAAGEKSREKRVEIIGLEFDEILNRLEKK